MTHRPRLLLAVAALLASLLTPAAAQSVDPSFYYKLSTQFRGNGMKLDVFNGGPKNNLTRLEPDQDVSGQFWRFVGNSDGTFRLSTLFRGPSMCLDIFNGGAKNNQPHLVNCTNFTGQLWNIMITGEGDWVRPKTNYTRPGSSPGFYNGGQNDHTPQLVHHSSVTCHPG